MKQNDKRLYKLLKSSIELIEYSDYLNRKAVQVFIT